LKLIELNADCRRVLGALLEKEQTTPDYYPLTLNALISACNQTTNRNPVMALKRHEVLAALHEMERYGMVERVTGPRTDRWRHTLIERIIAKPENKAVLTVLLLRGAQTPGELKSRTERMFSFSSLDEVDGILRELAAGDPPLVCELERKPGQKESRWMLNSPAGEMERSAPVILVGEEAKPSGNLDLEARVSRLEQKLDEVLEKLESLQTDAD